MKSGIKTYLNRFRKYLYMHHNTYHVAKQLEHLKKKEMKEIYTSITLKTFAVSLIAIFIPLYLYSELNYPFLDIIWFYLISNITCICLVPFFSKVISKIGLKHSILIAAPLQVLFLASLYMLKLGLFHYFIPAILFGVEIILFWLAFHSEFAKHSNKKGRGKQVSVWYSLSLGSTVFGPLVGALIITYFNFVVLFVLASVLIIISALPLFFSKESYEPIDYSLKHVMNKSHLKDSIIFTTRGFYSLTQKIFWPLFIFLILGSYISLGSLVSIVGVYTAIFTLIIGSLTTKIKYSKLIKIVTLINSLTYFVRVFVRTFSHILIISTFGMLSFILINVPMSAKVYNKANKSRRLEYIAFREIFYAVGRISSLFVVFIAYRFFFFDYPIGEAILYSISVLFVITGFIVLVWNKY